MPTGVTHIRRMDPGWAHAALAERFASYTTMLGRTAVTANSASQAKITV
jgi:hypothetical protein